MRLSRCLRSFLYIIQYKKETYLEIYLLAEIFFAPKTVAATAAMDNVAIMSFFILFSSCFFVSVYKTKGILKSSQKNKNFFIFLKKVKKGDSGYHFEVVFFCLRLLLCFLPQKIQKKTDRFYTCRP